MTGLLQPFGSARRRAQTWRHLLLSLLAAVFILPLYWMIVSALKGPSEIFAVPPVWIPSRWNWNHFVDVFQQVPFARWMFNSGFVSITVTLVALLTHSMAAYSLARLRYRGRRVLFGLIIGTLMVPFWVIMIPLYIEVRAFGWLDTYWALIIPAIPNAFGIFLLHQFYLGIPHELEEAATIDGCSKAGIFFRIVLPLSKPIMAALAVFFFVANWNSFLWPLLVTNATEMKTVQVGIAGFSGQYQNPWGYLMAANTIAVLPNLVVFLLLQRQLMASITMSGIKG
ncbi:sugar ABC transporter permease [Limnochorda pilosa]|uniref:Sugar ABC transporter permease n=1 Tax=Limnochorda pilosa TaxID=1555112 RepID=A0A0K2SL78_LIMPI|nr:sugar ABC transporter permease [Limnochorda pilosa]